MAREARERDGVADVFNSCCELHKALKSCAKAGMGNGAVFSELEIPPVVFRLKTKVDDFFLEALEALFALASADDFANFWNENIHRSNGLAVVVIAHVEGFDLCGVVSEDDGLFAMFFCEKPLVFRLQIDPPFDRELEGFS